MRMMHEEIKQAGGQGIKDVMTYLNTNQTNDLDDVFANLQDSDGNALLVNENTYAAFVTRFTGGAGATFMQNNLNLSNEDTGAIGGLDVEGSDGVEKTARSVVNDTANVTITPLSGFSVEVPTNGNVVDPRLAGRYNLQLGANADESIKVDVLRVDRSALGLNSVDLTTDTDDVITKVDAALDYISARRADFGASINRIQASISVNSISSQAMSQSRSRIEDADFSKETSALIREQILRSAATAILSQANASGQVALTLLG